MLSISSQDDEKDFNGLILCEDPVIEKQILVSALLTGSFYRAEAVSKTVPNVA